MSSEKKPGIGFSFSKTKPKSTLGQPSLSAFSEARQSQSSKEGRVELITSLEGKRVNVIDDGSNGSSSSTKKSAVVIPLIPNREIIKKRDGTTTTESVDEKLSKAKIKGDDLEAIRELMKDSENRKSGANGKSDQVKIDVQTTGGEK